MSAPVAQGIVQWCGQTDRGKVRANNEDAFLCLQFNAQEVHHLGKTGESNTGTHDFVFAVCDGMGGSLAGEFASRIAVDKVASLLPRSFKQSAQGMEAGRGDVLTELFDQIHRTLCFMGGSYEDCSGMGTTLSLCWCSPQWMFYAHIGDSRLYYLPASGGPLKQLSHDDTYVGWQYRNGQLTEWQARTHDRRHILQRALGAGNQFVEPQIGAVGYEPGDLFLLCSDGLTEGLFDSQIADLLRESGLSAPLVSAAVQADGHDNTTALIIRV
jgi:PPM family protein phosphatase